jgi:hypothetical protein
MQLSGVVIALAYGIKRTPSSQSLTMPWMVAIAKLGGLHREGILHLGRTSKRL